MANKPLDHFLNQFIKFVLPANKHHLLVSSDNRQNVFGPKQQAYEYIFLNQVLEEEPDIQAFLDQVFLHLAPEGRLIIIYRNYLHYFLKNLLNICSAQKIDAKNWLSTYDLKTFLSLGNFETIVAQPLCFTQLNIPLVSFLLNRLLLYFYPFNHLAFLHYMSARKKTHFAKDTSVSIIIPVRNEAGNIKKLLNALPLIGNRCEVIFVEGHSQDNTLAEVKKCIAQYQKSLPFKLKLINQGLGKGKADAVRQGFARAKGEILVIYDADMSIKAAELTKFYLAIISHQGELINGSRLIYPLQGQAMQSLNILGNKFFSLLYSWIIGQKIKDTLCGTKALWKKDYLQIKQDLSLTHKYDPFGDFDLLLGASKLNLKIIDLPVRYYERTYGTTNIKRFQNGWQLLKYSLLAIKELKLRL